MIDPGTWIKSNAGELIHATTVALSENALMQSQVTVAVEEFYQALLRATTTFDATPLFSLLFNWVDARSAPIGEDAASLMPVLAKIKQATAEQIFRLCVNPEDAVSLLISIDGIFTQALVFLAQIEAEALMGSLRAKVDSAQRDLQQLTKSKSDFIAIAAHELKTPLTVIEGYTGMMRGAADESEDEAMSLYLSGVDNGVRRLRDLVEDIIDVSMLDLQMMQLRYQPVWLHQLLDAVEHIVGEQVLPHRRVGLVIHRDTVPHQPTVADAEQLLKVLQKVVLNAIKYTPDGGVVTVSARELTGFVDLMVDDEGVGIDPTNLTRVFDAFSTLGDARLHSSSKVNFKGAGPGLGLPIAKGIIEAHGGSIWAESQGYNETTYPGSTFHIMIPMRSELPG